MASRSPDLTRSNSPRNVLSTLQRVEVSCVAPAACFSLNILTLIPFPVDCVIRLRHHFRARDGSVKSANPSEYG